MAQPAFTEVDFDPFADDLSRVVPTTEAQREVWLASQLGHEASLAYNESISLKMSGPVDRRSVQKALLALSDRHEALRSTLSADGLSLMIAARGRLHANVIELGSAGEAERVSVLAAARRDAVSEPFDLVRGPLIRATLYAMTPERHELIITAHHIVCDGWSFGIIASELMALYASFTGRIGTSVSLPQSDSFGDYALSQHAQAYQAQAETDTQWWMQQYDGNVPILEIPADKPRPPFRSFDSLREDIVLDAALVDGLRKLGQNSGASLFVTLFSMFGGLLARLTGQDDIVVGVPAAGQASTGGSALVGHCVQLLPIRIAADLEQPIPDLLKATRTRVLDAYEHQACTFGQLLKKLKFERSPGRLPLVSVLFNLDQAIRSEDLSVAGLTVALESNPRLFENFDLFVNASQHGGEIVVECQYSSGIFDGESIRRWLELYRTALGRAIADPESPVIATFAPTVADVARIAQFNATAMDYPRQLSVHALIERQAVATPKAIAVIAGDRRLTNRELDRRANGLAHQLMSRGVKSGDLVGLSCGRNEHMVIGLLGILKTGAGYVPMDPAFPAERLDYMRTQSCARSVVNDSSVAATVPVDSSDVLLADKIGEREGFNSPKHGDDDVAYVIYTSGSTGQPKGVRVAHRSVVNLLASVAREPGMTASDVVLSVTTLSFDIAVSEVILPLTVGARIVIADRSQAKDGQQLRALIEGEGVNFIDATPSTWRMLLAAGWKGYLNLKAICTGEPLPPDLGRLLLMSVGELWNGYGPTETTVWSSFHRVSDGNGPVPIGHPVANTQFHVVDDMLRPVPVGVVGEIYIGGDGVTLGYHGRPDLTAERFLPDPNRPGQTWYKTGDLGRLRNDGVMECLGRTDHQVKVRGYRIELGEIEAKLAQHADVERCVTIVREDEPGDVRLIAYAVSKGPSLESTLLREHLRQSLPAYMIPSLVMQVPAIPLLPNGKIDRSKLPCPELTSAIQTGGHQPARTSLEAQVLLVMEEVLKLPGLSVTDDFFALGGHSLLAAKLTARLNQEFCLALPLRTIFELPTAEALAKAVEMARASGEQKRAATLRQADQSCGPLTLMQDRIRFMEEMNPGRVVYNTPSAHRLSGPFDRQAFATAFQMLVQRNPALRTLIDTSSRPAVQRVLPHLYVELPFEDLSELAAGPREAELMRRMQAIVDQPIDITRGPLFRIGLWRLNELEHAFLFMPHHIIWDGWSFDLLYQEMALLYPAALSRSPVRAPAPAASYLDFSGWQKAWLSSDECQAQVDHWRRRFQSVEVPGGLPTDHPRRPGMTGEGAVEWVKVDKALVEQLRKISQDNGATLNMLLLAVYVAMIVTASSSRSTVVGIPVRGRQIADFEPVMGFFNNLLPVRFELEPGVSLSDWLKSVKTEIVGAFAHQDVPFERLVEEPEIARHTSQLYQSLFSFQDARERIREWGQLSHSSILVMQKGATEDLGLWLMEVPGGLEGGVNYNTGLFDASTARMFRDRLLGLLRRIADQPNETLATLLTAPGPDTDAFTDWIRTRRAALSAVAPRIEVGAVTAGALSQQQALIADMWADLIGIDISDISPEDNFFDLGGTSMLAIKAVQLSERKLGLQIDPSRMVRETLKQIAATPVTIEPTGTSSTSSLPATGTDVARVDELDLDRVGGK